MAQQRKTAAEYGQLSLFEETVPEWLQPAEPPLEPPSASPHASTGRISGDDDDLSQFMTWLQNKNSDNQQA